MGYLGFPSELEYITQSSLVIAENYPQSVIPALESLKV